MKKEVTIDSRVRVSLGGVRTKHYTRYLAEEEPDGTIILTPLVVVPARLARITPADAEPART